MDATRIDTQLCRQCQGRCCQGHPGVWSDPQRFFDIFTNKSIPSAAQLSTIIKKHLLCLRNVGEVLIPAPQQTEAGCIFQKLYGCNMTIAERPCQCLALTPNLDTLLDEQIHCTLPPEFGSNSARENWRTFQSLLEKVEIQTTQAPAPLWQK